MGRGHRSAPTPAAASSASFICRWVELAGGRQQVRASATGVAMVPSRRRPFPGLCTPDDSYHGVTYAERFGREGAFITKATAQLMRDFGSMLSPQSAFILNLGLESLHVRMARHCENGQAVAEYLQNHPKIAWVRYSGLPGDPYYSVARKYLPQGSCGVVSFGVKGGRQAAETFMGRLRLGTIATHVADARTCCLHPASSTHRQMNDAELEAAGVSADLVRLSVGLESREDLIADLEQALAAV